VAPKCQHTSTVADFRTSNGQVRDLSRFTHTHAHTTYNIQHTTYNIQNTNNIHNIQRKTRTQQSEARSPGQHKHDSVVELTETPYETSAVEESASDSLRAR